MPTMTLSRDKVQALCDFCHEHNLTRFFLAKDHGAYIGAASADKDTGKVTNLLYYFAGCDPNKDVDFYLNAKYKFGGDDFGEFFEVSTLSRAISNHRVRGLKFNVGRTRISITAIV